MGVELNSVHEPSYVPKSKPRATSVLEGDEMSHSILRPNRMLIVCVPRNQVYTHIIQEMDTK
jgi:hypothetical protein